MTRIPSEDESDQYTRQLLIEIERWRKYTARMGIRKVPTVQERALKVREPLKLPAVNPLPPWWFYPDGYRYIPCTLKHGPAEAL